MEVTPTPEAITQPATQNEQPAKKVILPFDLNNLVNFQHSFDVLKGAIEYLAQQHQDSAALLASIAGFGSNDPKSPLNRLKQCEEQLGNHEFDLSKYGAELITLKRRIGSGGETSGGGGEVAPDQVQALYDSISELRNEMVSKKQFDDFKGKTDDHLDQIDLQLKRLSRDVQDLFSLEKVGQPNTANSNGANADVLRMIDELSDQMFLRQTIAEATKSNEDLLERIAKLTEKVEASGAAVTQDNIDTWNQAVIKSNAAEKDIDKIFKDLSKINADHFTAELKNLNVLILQMTPKVDHDKLAAEVNRQKNQISDLDYSVNNITAKVNDVDSKAESFAQFARIEMDKINEKLDKLEASTQQIRKIIGKVTDEMKANSGQIDPSQLLGMTKEDFDRLQLQVQTLQAFTDKSVVSIRQDLDTKATLIDVQNVQSTLMDRLNELMTNFDGMFADKEGTRKKIAQLEKALKQLHDMVKQLSEAGFNQVPDDVMLTKKPMGPIDCASCDKNVVNLNGMRAEHLSWNRLPFREPNERIAKYGQGFSRFLAASGHTQPGQEQIQLKTAIGKRAGSQVEMAHTIQAPVTTHGRPVPEEMGFSSPTQKTITSGFGIGRQSADFMNQGHSQTELKKQQQSKMMTIQPDANRTGRPTYIDTMLPNVKNISNASTNLYTHEVANQ